MPDTDDDLSSPRPFSSEAQEQIERLPLVNAMRKLLSREIGGARKEARKMLREASEALQQLRDMRTELAAMQAELRLEQLMTDAPGMTPARRSFIRGLATAEKPADVEAWFVSTIDRMTARSK